ncbi:MAG: DNA polymerase III subunit delta [Ruminococcus sp.]|nr:DNA polymerase III subunit delta [Ruminococcus sp.]
MPVITEAELKKQIKQKNFSPVYVIHGSEQMFIKRYTEKLTEAVTGKHPSDFNYHQFSGDINLDELAAAMQIVPFMSEYNCVLVSDVFLDSMDADSVARFKDICSQAIDGTVLIVSMPSYVPKKNAAALKAIIKFASKNGSVCEFKESSPMQLERFVAKWANENGKLISEINASRIVQNCGTDLNLLKNEVDKISAYAKGEEITLTDIDMLCTVNLESRIFTLSDMVLNGEGDKAFTALDRLFYQKEDPISMLYVLSNAFIDAYRVRVADECGIPPEKAAEDFDYKKRAFVLKKARKATSRVSTSALRQCLDILKEADVKFKSTSVNYRLALEQLIARLLLIAREGRA